MWCVIAATCKDTWFKLYLAKTFHRWRNEFSKITVLVMLIFFRL